MTAEEPLEIDSYRTRIRFRVGKKLNIPSSKHAFVVAGREALLQAPTEEILIQDSDWLIVNTRGFENDEEARVFGRNLQTSLHLASAVTRIGLDPGQDRPTSALAQHFKEGIAARTGKKIRDNVHGLDVFVGCCRFR